MLRWVRAMPMVEPERPIVYIGSERGETRKETGKLNRLLSL